MKNSERFNELAEKFLEDNFNYKNEIENFKRYLKERMIEEKIFILSENEIDEYFKFSFEAKIGAVPTLTTHISALKQLFNFLISNGFDFKSHRGYITTAGFKERLELKLLASFQKNIIDDSLLKSVLYRMDSYISENILNDFKNKNEKRRFVEILIARLYAKLSLILPLKVNEILNISFSNFDGKLFREIEHNKVHIAVPNSLRINICDTLEFISREYNAKNSGSDLSIFKLLYSTINKKFATSSINESMVTCYKTLEITELLNQRQSGKKEHYIYPPESYKLTAILQMLNNGVNLLYLKQLTGLEFSSLISNYDFEEYVYTEDITSADINKGLIRTEYYSYI